MVNVRDHGATTIVGRGSLGETRPLRLPLTLFDLISNIQDVVGPADNGLVVATVRYLLQSGRLTGFGSYRPLA
jgi:hypothetical protein